MAKPLFVIYVFEAEYTLCCPSLYVFYRSDVFDAVVCPDLVSKFDMWFYK